eukprot:TRINITY_DN11807_c0_g1_i3.p1 TRINITY_DN11807_c0_g1~~TRINITY_DN11807_c0_g1_i3.p1  ORF type:complete len:170 (-),score=35.82 TRINITY_DN11807_c0_g1_i3:64-573(-)
MLCEHLGASKVIWLGQGVFMDETDGHVDNLCCFSSPGHVTLAWCDDEKDPMYAICRDAEKRLNAEKDAKGRTLTIHRILIPDPTLFSTSEDRPFHYGPNKAHRLAGSYVNYYLANGGVIVPQFGLPTDALAVAALQKVFPDRKIVGVMSRNVLLGGGNIHCITQQVPKA